MHKILICCNHKTLVQIGVSLNSTVHNYTASYRTTQRCTVVFRFTHWAEVHSIVLNYAKHSRCAEQHNYNNYSDKSYVLWRVTSNIGTKRARPVILLSTCAVGICICLDTAVVYAAC